MRKSFEKSSYAEIQAEKKERLELVEKYLEQLAEPLKLEAKRLKEKGFPLSDDGRVNFETEDTQNDNEKVVQLEKMWEGELTEEGRRGKKTGELFEMVKTLSINNLWFDKRLVSVRTNKYDDYINGVDNLIFDLETNQPLAAIDDTTHALKQEDPRVIDKIKMGAEVKYGVDYTNEVVTKKSYKKLPVFVISTNVEGLITLAKDVINGKSSFEGIQVLQNIIGDLEEQYQKIKNGIIEIDDPELKSAYQKAGKIFMDL